MTDFVHRSPKTLNYQSTKTAKWTVAYCIKKIRSKTTYLTQCLSSVNYNTMCYMLLMRILAIWLSAKHTHFCNKGTFWPGMKKQIANHIKTCEQCIQENLKVPPYISGSLKLVNQPMYHFTWDLTGLFPTSQNGNTYCLAACCALTDYLFCKLIPKKEAENVVQTYLKNIYVLSGGSRVLLSDNGTQFKNLLFAKVGEMLNMTQHLSQCICQVVTWVERHHSSLKRWLAKFCRKDASR